MSKDEAIWKEYAAAKAVDMMDNVEVLEFVDARVVSCFEMTMTEYRIKAIELILEAA